MPVRTGLDRFLQFQDKESRIDIFLENVKRDEIIKKMKHPALTKQKSSSNEKNIYLYYDVIYVTSYCLFIAAKLVHLVQAT